MNLIVAIFLYLGLANPTSLVITEADIENHQIEIEQTVESPAFRSYYEAHLNEDGIFVIDIDER